MSTPRNPQRSPNSMAIEIKITTVAKVTGLSPDEWQADRNHVYTGRYQVIRSGRYAGQIWYPQGWGNSFWPDIDAHATKAAAVKDCVDRYEKDLADRVKRQARELLQPMRMLAGKVLGCWCVSWDGITTPRPQCHAAVLADWVNRMQAGERPWEAFA